MSVNAEEKYGYAFEEYGECHQTTTMISVENAGKLNLIHFAYDPRIDLQSVGQSVFESFFMLLSPYYARGK